MIRKILVFVLITTAFSLLLAGCVGRKAVKSESVITEQADQNTIEGSAQGQEDDEKENEDDDMERMD